tara:strand:- start:695 stop:1036 length:342 start_codon:yes stop_codon:yes gene_type:complete
MMMRADQSLGAYSLLSRVTLCFVRKAGPVREQHDRQANSRKEAHCDVSNFVSHIVSFLLFGSTAADLEGARVKRGDLQRRKGRGNCLAAFQRCRPIALRLQIDFRGEVAWASN